MLFCCIKDQNFDIVQLVILYETLHEHIDIQIQLRRLCSPLCCCFLIQRELVKGAYVSFIHTYSGCQYCRIRPTNIYFSGWGPSGAPLLWMWANGDGQSQDIQEVDVESHTPRQDPDLSSSLVLKQQLSSGSKQQLMTAKWVAATPHTLSSLVPVSIHSLCNRTRCTQCQHLHPHYAHTDPYWS